jgi:hypothetical protein
MDNGLRQSSLFSCRWQVTGFFQSLHLSTHSVGHENLAAPSGSRRVCMQDHTVQINRSTERWWLPASYRGSSGIVSLSAGGVACVVRRERVSFVSSFRHRRGSSTSGEPLFFGENQLLFHLLILNLITRLWSSVASLHAYGTSRQP